MATITLKNVPDDLHRRLKAQAARNHRSLNREVIRTLEAWTQTEDATLAGLVAEQLRDPAWERARAVRDELRAEGASLTSDDVESAISEGRP